MDLAGNRVVVRVWRCESDSARELLLEADVNLMALIFVGKEVRCSAGLLDTHRPAQLSVGPQVILPADSLLFFLKDGTYCLPNDEVFCVCRH